MMLNEFSAKTKFIINISID